MATLIPALDAAYEVLYDIRSAYIDRSFATHLKVIGEPVETATKS